MSIFDCVPAIATINVLTDSTVSKMKYFTFEGHTFSPLYLAGLAEDIKYNYLKVSTSSEPYYSAVKNTIYLNFPTPKNAGQRAMIVHEATHAMFDFQGRKMDVATSESLSFIAQCMYARLSGAFNLNDPEDRLSSWDWDANGDAYYLPNDAVFKKGWEIAASILAGGVNIFAVSGRDVTEMRSAVAAHPNYKSNHLDKTDFNGYR